jgi:hypothetical protein
VARLIVFVGLTYITAGVQLLPSTAAGDWLQGGALDAHLVHLLLVNFMIGAAGRYLFLAAMWTEEVMVSLLEIK